MISSIIAVFTRMSALQVMLALTIGLLPLQPGRVQAQAIEYVVFSIDGTVEGLSLGQVLNEGYRFEVPENASVNLISKQGEIITLAGPAVATVTTEEKDEAGERALASISNLLFDDNKFVQTIGGTRSTGEETNVKKLLLGQNTDQAWFPVLSDVEIYCLQRDEAIIRRETADDDLTLQLGNNNFVRWKAGAHEFNLGEHLSKVQDKYTSNLGIDGKNIQVFVTDQRDSTIVEQVAWLANKGCTHQAIKLLASTIPD